MTEPHDANTCSRSTANERIASEEAAAAHADIEHVLQAFASFTPLRDPDSTLEQAILRRLAQQERSSARRSSFTASLWRRVQGAWHGTDPFATPATQWALAATCAIGVAASAALLYRLGPASHATQLSTAGAPVHNTTDVAAATPAAAVHLGTHTAPEHSLAEADSAAGRHTDRPSALAPMPALPATSANAAPSLLRTNAAIRDVASSSVAAAAGLPMQTAPLTQQERLLLQIARRGDPGTLALLDPEARARSLAAERASTDRFFAPPPLPPELQAEIDSSVRAQYAQAPAEDSPVTSVERTMP